MHVPQKRGFLLVLVLLLLLAIISLIIGNKDNWITGAIIGEDNDSLGISLPFIDENETLTDSDNITNPPIVENETINLDLTLPIVENETLIENTSMINESLEISLPINETEEFNLTLPVNQTFEENITDEISLNNTFS